MGIAHILDTVRYHFSRRKRIQHAVMTHCDTVIHCYGIEFGSKASQLFNLGLDFLAYLMEMDMARNELGKGVDYGYDRLAELAVLHTVCSP